FYIINKVEGCPDSLVFGKSEKFLVTEENGYMPGIKLIENYGTMEYACVPSSGAPGIISFSPEKKGWMLKRLKRYPSKLTFSVYADSSEHRIWFGSDKGLICYNSDKERLSDCHFNVLFRQISISNDSVVHNGYATSLSEPEQIFEYSLNSISFRFAAAWYTMEDSTQYSWMLEGFDKTNENRSDWTYERKANYTNLPEGDYTFRVKAKNIYGVTGNEATFRFCILPPWYRTVTAYIIYFLIILVFLYTIIRLNSRRLRAANIRLERIISLRTAEIVRQKEEIQERNTEIIRQKEEIERHRQQLVVKNTQILDSITYAKLIQQTMLPPIDIIRRHLPESFIFYRPRDIVSGDFYWMTETDIGLYIAVVDCTGHGVPGALMSMIGNTLLNEIIIYKRIAGPRDILNELDSGIRYTLSRHHGDTYSQEDGMAVSLCRIDRKKNEVILGLAGQSAIVIIDGELILVKGALVSPGGYLFDTKKEELRESRYSVSPGMSLYLYTDGYTDQFGGEDNIKFMVAQFTSLINSIYMLDPELQRMKIEAAFDEWRSTNRKDGIADQVDDVTVLGFRL
ncbi:MAG: SpoIIE family protein phosphatase, partial [Bacteroidetes bacterium]|nr:SpoIIE family protein phosphatase [Bacteroidota bacterium]